MSSTSIEYVDTTIYSGDQLSELLHIADKKPVLLYMPDIDYGEMQRLEDFAKENNLKLINIPITLPLMDIVKQAEYAGVEITSEFIANIRSGLRILITSALNGVV